MSLEEFEKKLSELEDLHAELKAQIAELKERDDEKPKPPHLRPYPECDQNYFWIDGAGGIRKARWVQDMVDLRIRELGNVFMGESAAEFFAERMKVLAEMREWAGNWDDPVVLTYVGNDDIVSISNLLLSRNTFGEMRFATKEDAYNCIKAVGEDRIKKYYFMIPEEETNNG